MENVGETVLSADVKSPAEKFEKYSLRPRTSVKRDDTEEFESWKPRSKSKRRPKSKPAPLSKYRRKTANARERSRMREINEGFETLRQVLPHLPTEKDTTNEKLTKISTLKLAMKYINALNRILREPEVESDGESFFSEYTLTTPPGSDQALTPPTFSDHSLSTDFSDQMLSPSDFSDSILPPSSDSLDGLTSSSLPLVSPNDFSGNYFSDFGETSFDSNLSSCCLPEISFDDTAYVFDQSNYLTNFP